MSWQWKLLIEDCTGCGICADVCPEGAVQMARDTAYPLPVTGLCTGCMKCVRECPFEAVEVREEKEREGGEKRGVL